VSLLYNLNPSDVQFATWLVHSWIFTIIHIQSKTTIVTTVTASDNANYDDDDDDDDDDDNNNL
jgi:hypothetical protein